MGYLPLPAPPSPSVADRNALVEANLPLVRWVISRLAGRLSREQVEDLFQVGVLGLMRAAERYDPARGTAFSTLANRCIHHEVLRELSTHGNLIRLPRDVTGEERACLRARLSARAGPALEDVAAPRGDTDRAELPAAVAAALARLPARHALALRLRFHQGLRLRQVAEELGVTTQAASQMIRRALRRLKPLLADWAA